MSRILIVAPAFNEEQGIDQFVGAIDALRIRLQPHHELRLLIVDDGSTDGTIARLRELAARHLDWVSYLGFAANAGHQAAMIAGLWHGAAWPDAAITMDADLEHPVDTVPDLIAAWERSRAVIVQARRLPTVELSWTKRWPSAAFYRLTSWLTGLKLEPGHADFRLWDAAILRNVRPYLVNVGSLRVFAAWLPGPKETVEYRQHVRADRQSRFTLRKNLHLAAISIVRFSHAPLTAITVLGAMGLIFSFLYGSWAVIVAWQGRAIPGWSSTVLVVMTMGCLQLVSLGILASYLRRLVFARDLPPFVIRESGAELPGRDQ
jgi:polyisoprenyl-phosphate glycosyltransferase